MRRRLLNLLTALSVLLCVAVCGLWVRSDTVADRVGYTRGMGSGEGNYLVDVDVATYSGHAMLLVMVRPLAYEPTRWTWTSNPIVHTGSARRGFGYEHISEYSYEHIPEYRGLIVHVPLWFPTLLLGVLPAYGCYRRVLRRPRAGCCRSCGYDLRATPGRCPECGTEATTPT